MAPAAQELSSRRRGWILLAATSALSMVLMNETAISVALPRMAADLGLGEQAISWVVTSYLLAFASLVALGGRLGDLLGLRTLLLSGVTLFGLASIGCGLSSSAPAILFARGLQGVGAAFMVPASAAIVINHFPMASRGRAMAIYAGMAQVCLALGPLLGGAATEFAGWNSAFYVNVPLSLACVLSLARGRPGNHREEDVAVDYAGAVLLAIGVGAFVLVIQQGQAWGWASPPVAAGFGGGVLVLVGFVFVERRREQPLVQLDLLRIRPFLIDAWVLFCVQFTIAAIAVFGALYLERVLDFSPLGAGSALLALAIPIFSTTQVAGWLFDRFGSRWVCVVGLGLAGIGNLWAAHVLPWASYPDFAIGLAVLGFGLGLTLSPSNTDALNRLPAGARGQGSGILQTIRQTGGALGIAAMTATVAVVEAKRSAGAAPDPSTLAAAFAWAYRLAGVVCLGGAVGAFFLPTGPQRQEPRTIDEAVALGRG